MFFSIEVLDLLLYCVQQLGVMLAVGAETIVLIAYIVAMRDGKINETEARFSRAVHRALAVGILCIVSSGIIITVVHGSIGEISTILQPVFLFKWALIVGLICIYIWQRGKPFSHYLIEGVIGGTWYALFLVHILAPITSWLNLITLYVILLAGFVGVWSAIAVFTRNRESPAKIVPILPTQKPKEPLAAAIAKPVPMPPVSKTSVPVAKPIATAVVAPMPIPVVQAALAPKPAEPLLPEAHHSPWLPAIHVMPQNQAHLDAKKHITTLAALTKHA